MLARSVMFCLSLATSCTVTDAQDKPTSSVADALQGAPEASVDAKAALMAMREVLRTTDDLEFESSFSISGGDRGRTLYRIRKPNLFHIEVASKNKKYTFISDSKTLTMYRSREGKFAQIPARDSVIGTMYAAAGILAAQARVLDFFWTVDYAGISEEVRVSAIKATIVGNRKCNGFSVERFEDRWEVWLEATGVPMPCKLISRRKDGSALTVQSNEFKWVMTPNYSAKTFEFSAPQGTNKVDIIDLK